MFRKTITYYLSFEVYILELSQFPCPGVGICHTSKGLGLRPVKELDLKHWEWLRGGNLSLHLTRNHDRGGGQGSESRSDPKSPTSRVWLFLVQSVTVPVGHSLTLNTDQINYLSRPLLSSSFLSLQKGPCVAYPSNPGRSLPVCWEGRLIRVFNPAFPRSS